MKKNEKLKKEKKRFTTMNVDFEAWEALNIDKRLGRDSLNRVLRRRLGMESGTLSIVGLAEQTYHEELVGVSMATIGGKTLLDILNKLFKTELWETKPPKKIRITIEEMEW